MRDREDINNILEVGGKNQERGVKNKTKFWRKISIEFKLNILLAEYYLGLMQGMCTAGMCTAEMCTAGMCTAGMCTAEMCTEGMCTAGMCTAWMCTAWMCRHITIL
jgi:hypothetical protein